MKEIWKDITDFEGLYQVSNLGRVKSLSRIVTSKNGNRKWFLKSQILKSFDNGRGYRVVHLRKDNKRHVCYVHRLVAQHFLNDFDKNKTINHIDFNRKNNKIDNLECITQGENIYHSLKNNRYKDVNSKRIVTTNKRIKQKKKILKKEILKLYDEGLNITKISHKVHLKYEYVKEVLKENKRKRPIVKCVETNEVFNTVSEANRKYNVTTIGDTISGRQKTSAGLHWIKTIER